MAAVVLNHRTAEATSSAVASLMASRRRPELTIVVDNDLVGDDRARLMQSGVSGTDPRCGSQVVYLHTGRNLGFAGGMNVGIRKALAEGVDSVLLVNSDIVVSPDCLERLESAIYAQKNVGVAGPLVLSRARPDRVASAGIRYNRHTGRMRVLGEGRRADGSERRLGAVDAVSGCLMLITRAAFENIGLLDDRFFFGFEDLDFCLRARDAGISTILVGSAVAYHEGGRTIGHDSARRFYFGVRNHLHLASRRQPNESKGWRACRLSWVVTLSVAHALTADAGSRSGRLAATATGVRDYLRDVYGPDAAAQ